MDNLWRIYGYALHLQLNAPWPSRHIMMHSSHGDTAPRLGCAKAYLALALAQQRTGRRVWVPMMGSEDGKNIGSCS